MLDTSYSFEEDFFSYQIPHPLTSIYSEDMVRSNDLRLLLQIATSSYLRMYTDSKTNTLHFICKQRGQHCFDVQAFPTSFGKTYYFPLNYQEKRHKNSCEQKNQAFRYLQIYNLMKLKKSHIETFMMTHQLMKQSPSIILSMLSSNSDSYFFQKYIQGQLELKRKLRKRFDNIVNIDIKKIGKNQEKIEEQPQKQKKNPETPLKRIQINGLHTKKQIKENSDSVKKKCISKQPKTKKKIAIHRNDFSDKDQQSSSKPNQNHENRGESIVLLNNNLQVKQQQLYFSSQSQPILPQLKVLQEEAELYWGSSSQEHIEREEVAVDNILNLKQDYFQSLRNSALKKSLQRQSLTSFVFFSETNKQNCN